MATTSGLPAPAPCSGGFNARHIARVRSDGSHDGPAPSSDTILHAAIYALGDAGAVVHAHPRHAIALSFDCEAFVPGTSKGSFTCRMCRWSPRGRGKSSIALALRERRIVVLRGHGAYARGKDLWEALHWTTALEESAHMRGRPAPSKAEMALRVDDQVAKHVV